MSVNSPTPARPSTGVVADSMDAKSNVAPAGVIIQSKAVVPRETELKGEITIGSRSVLHPSCKILAMNGPIVIGEGNIVEEKVEIANRFSLNDDGSGKTLLVGSRNLIEAYAVVEGNVGNNNTICSKARIGPQTTLSTGCVIGCMCVLDASETLPPDTIILGDHQERRILDQPQTPPFIDDHLEHLLRHLPMYHHILKSSSN